MTTPKNKELNQAILACMGEIGGVSKDKRNAQQGYDYVSETAVLAAAQPLMVKYGLVMSLCEIKNPFRETKQTQKGGSLTLCGGTFVFRIEHAESGQSKVIESMGEGMDSGDKASYKAQTGARKNALFDLFLIPRKDDPENDSGSRSSPQRVSTPAKTTKPPATGQPDAKPGYGRKTHISPAQGKRLFAICKQAGVSEVALKMYMKKTFGIEHSYDIKWGEQYDAICKAVESGMLANTGDDITEPAGQEDEQFDTQGEEKTW